jgi:hypothetical protein
VTKKPELSSFFTIGQSRWLKATIGFLHALSVLACWLNDLTILYSLALSLLVIVSWHFQHNKACKASCIYLRYTPTGGWTVSLDGNEYFVVQIRPTTMVGRMLTVLHFSAKNSHSTFVIFKDAMTANDYRRLIVALKISGYSQG